MKLDYPFADIDVITRRKKIKRELLARDVERRKIKLAILGGSTTSEIKHALEIFLLDRGIMPEFYESDYNQYFNDVVSNNRKLLSFEPELVYIHTSYVNIARFPTVDMGSAEVDQLLLEELDHFQVLWDKIFDLFDCSIIQNNFDLPPYRSLGNLDACLPQGKTHYIQRLNEGFARAAQDMESLYLQDINYLSAFIGLEKWWDDSLYYAYKYALSYVAIPHLALNLANMIRALYGMGKKCLVLDLDDTLWGGVIGDDGLEGIHIGRETAIAEAHTALQEYVVALRDQGVVLAICSKNEEQNARMGLSHPDNILRFDDFAAFKANWDAKSHNIVQIAQELNLGLDSFVFLDDSPAEREIVRQQVAEVVVPELNGGIEGFLRILDRNSWFEPVMLGADDRQRNRFYVENAQRQRLKGNIADYGVYLASLEMEAEIREFVPLYIDRITQLVNKTNQFNLTARRFNRSEICGFMDLDRYIALYGRLKDRFGDNGLSSVVIGEIKGAELHLFLWVMSCRVFKRDLEYAMFDAVVGQCRSRGVERIVGYFSPTAKNIIVRDFYADLDFASLRQTDDEQEWRWQIPADYQNKNRYIGVS
jgi:FkbH-like protein